MFTSRRKFGTLAALAPLAARLWNEPQLLAVQGANANEKIEKARLTALSLISPSDRDVAHGLDLHANSIVFDSYGFAPRCAVNGAAFQQAIDANRSDAELADLRLDMMLSRAADDETERREFLEAFHAAGVTCIFQNAGEEGNDAMRMMKRLSPLTYLTDKLDDVCPKVISPDDIVQAKAAGRVCLAMTTNGVPLKQTFENSSNELSYVRLFKQLGVHMMHLTYNRRNPLGDGCGELNDGGLSDFGRTAIAELNRLGIIIDVAHSGWRTSLEAAKASARPMVASHTACAALHKHFRGKPDDTIKAICDTGGLIGICCIPKFLGGKGDINAFLDHIDYALKTFGEDHVAIGTDIAFVSRNESTEAKKFKPRPRSRPEPDRWESLWPPFDFRESTSAVESLAWTNWPLFTVGMVQRGHSDATIRKVLGENMLRVFRSNFK
jgi:membrane dipeptidase